MAKGKSDIRKRLRIGTSGWYYNHWLGRFYPDGLAKSKWFEYYAKDFDTVELNNTFYHQPKETSVKRWYKQSPKKFVYAVKANRYITHIKRLKETEEPLERFFENIGPLGEKLGPILYQLPPSFHKDLGTLASFIKLLPKQNQAVFEFRHSSWFCEDTYELLNKLSAGFCVHDMQGVSTPRIITGNIIYIRFHGASARYAGNYKKGALKKWAEWIKENGKGTCSVYAYFNNDYNAYAVSNARQLREQF